MKKLKTILHNSKMQHCFFWSLWVSTLAALVLWILWDAGFRFNATESMPVGVYRLSPGMPERGEMASFCLRDESAELARERGYLEAGSCPSDLRPLLKTVAGQPGDTLQQDYNGLIVNG